MSTRSFRFALALSLVVATLLVPAPNHAAESKAPHFRAKDVLGNLIDLDELLKKGPVLLDFWATWCKPCIKSLPELQAWHEEFGPQGLTVVGISVDGPRNRSRVRPFANRLGLEYTIVVDDDGRIQDLYKVLAIPTAMLIDTTGMIVHVRVAYRPGEGHRFESSIRALLQAPPAVDTSAVSDVLGEDDVPEEPEDIEILGGSAPSQVPISRPISSGVVAAPDPVQISGGSLLEAQVGNFPGSDPDNRQDLYGQVSLEYGWSSGRVGGRFETNRASEEGLAVPYEEIVQRYVDLSDSRFRLRVGNFYTILGRGLIHRSFELKGVILDQLGLRSRFGPSRDVDGVLAEADFGHVDVRMMSGSPAGGDQSPGALKFIDSDRHLGQVGGGQIAATIFREARAGVSYLRSSFGGRDSELNSGFIEIDPLHVFGVEDIQLPFYVEYAQIDGSFEDWWRFRTGADMPHALYMSSNILWGPVSFSAEWKDYSQFRLGTNDPPSLVREHGFALLNRSTHILDAELSVGYQLEANVIATDWATVTGNLSRTDGIRGERFDEHYLEVNAMPNGGHPWEATAFYDGGKDEIIGITERATVGAQGTYEFMDRFSATLDVQRQSGEREAVPLIVNGSFVIQPMRYEDIYLSFNVARANYGSLGLVWQRTSDPADPSREDLGTTPLHTFAAVISARVSEHHEATLTAGQRRGGIACTAGTCYEVQPFEGVELRLVSRF